MGCGGAGKEDKSDGNIVTKGWMGGVVGREEVERQETGRG